VARKPTSKEHQLFLFLVDQLGCISSIFIVCDHQNKVI